MKQTKSAGRRFTMVANCQGWKASTGKVSSFAGRTAIERSGVARRLGIGVGVQEGRYSRTRLEYEGQNAHEEHTHLVTIWYISAAHYCVPQYGWYQV